MNRRVRTEVGEVQRNARDWYARQDDYASYDDDGYATGAVSEVYDDGGAASDQEAPGYALQIAVVRPKNFMDAASVGEYYRQGIPVIINLEDLSNADAARIIDFAAGLVLGLCGDIERLSKRTFLITPSGADILTAL
jgi:cell division inhibitor SepF